VEGGLEGGDRGQVAGADDDGDAAVVEGRLAYASDPTPPPDAAVSDAGEPPIPARKTARIT
jgi:hypothetical protein